MPRVIVRDGIGAELPTELEQLFVRDDWVGEETRTTAVCASTVIAGDAHLLGAAGCRTRCASSTVSPHPGITPTRAVRVGETGTVETGRGSRSSTRASNPPVTATPFTAPMSGFACGGRAPRNRGQPSRRSPTSANPSPGAPHRAELLQVDTCAKRRISSSEDHHVDVIVGIAPLDRGWKRLTHGAVQRVAGLGPVDRDQRGRARRRRRGRCSVQPQEVGTRP